MYARLLTLAIAAAAALPIPAKDDARFELGSTGAATVRASGSEARYFVASDGRHTISLGAQQGSGALTLSLPAGSGPTEGRHELSGSASKGMRAAFVAGTVEQPVGWFGGESGWVRVTDVQAGRVSGEFEIRARGFVRANPDDENQWVTVRGTFEAKADSAVATVATVDRN